MLRVFPTKKTNRAFVGVDIILNRQEKIERIRPLKHLPFDLGSLLYIGNEKLPTYIGLFRKP